MSTSLTGVPAKPSTLSTSAVQRLPLLFGSTILASASLLFLVQPLASKLILPWFGGSAAVWTTCMLFFQAGLLLGYLHAHNLVQRLSGRQQRAIHAGVLTLSLFALPIFPNARWQLQGGEDPTWRVFAVLATSVGVPYLLLSSTSPLLQTWYARAFSGALPYRYFALSNAGSLVALFAYPVIVEPYLTGHQQAWLWSGAYALFVILCVTSAVASRNSTNAEAYSPPAIRTATSTHQYVLWLSLSACASALLIAVTNMLTQNIAPMPFLWVLPLGLYLLTFILCFESDRWYRRTFFLLLLVPSLVCLTAGTGPLRNEKISLIIPLMLGALFICCMSCHGELARLRPAPDRLTRFYLCLSAGGVLGGLFVALLAPHIFPATFEYPITFTATAALVLFTVWPERTRIFPQPPSAFLRHAGPALAIIGVLGVAGYASYQTWRDMHRARLLARNFYGTLRIEDRRNSAFRNVRELFHGTITHGIQFTDPFLRREPTTYYGTDSGIGLTWRTLAQEGPIRMGVIGLGAGTLASYGRQGDFIRFYDINPLVVKLAQTQFTFLSDCPAQHDIVTGDARLSMSHEASQQFDIIVVDAFSGDAIPVHLLTREAFALYWKQLKPNGILAVHVSNRYLDLAPLVAVAAKESGRQVWEIDNEDDDDKETFNASYVLVTSRPGFFNSKLFKGEKTEIVVPPRIRPWTDDYSNLWQVLKYQ